MSIELDGFGYGLRRMNPRAGIALTATKRTINGVEGEAEWIEEDISLTESYFRRGPIRWSDLAVDPLFAGSGLLGQMFAFNYPGETGTDPPEPTVNERQIVYTFKNCFAAVPIRLLYDLVTYDDTDVETSRVASELSLPWNSAVGPVTMAAGSGTKIAWENFTLLIPDPS